MLKTKKILIALAVIGANVLHSMPVHTGLAAPVVGWVGNNDYATLWTSNRANSCSTGANLVLDGTDAQGVPGIASFDSAKLFCAGLGENGNLTNNVITIVSGAQFNFTGGQYVAAAALGLKDASNNGVVTGNKIVINDGTFNFTEDSDVCPEIVAGLVVNKGDHEHTVGNNSVEVNGGTFKGTGNIIGGEMQIASGSNTGIVGGTSLENGNRVIVNNATFDSGANYKIIGGYNNSYSDIPVQYNSVEIQNASMGSGAAIEVYGGLSISGDDPVEHNKVVLKSGTFAGVTGGQGNLVRNNKVYIYDGNFNIVSGGSSDLGNAENNELHIYGGNFINAQIYGAYNVSSSGDTHNAIDNKVHIYGGNFEDGFMLAGGIPGDGAGSTSSGNVLDLQTKIGGKAEAVLYFQKMNFTLPAGITSDEIMLEIVPSIFPLDIAGALAGVNVTTNLNGLVLEPGDYITLIRNVDDTGFTEATSGLGHYIVEIGGVKELVYANGTPTPKGDYTIKQGNVRGDSEITGNYTTSILGNTDGTGLATVMGGTLSATSYSGNEIIVRRGTYQDIEMHVAKNTEGGNVTNNTLSINGGTFNLQGAKRITAGMLELGSSVAGDVTGNKIVIKGGEYNFKQLSGEFPEVVAGYVSSTADEVASIVSNNVIEINGGTFKTTNPTSKKSSFIGGKKKVNNGNAACYVGGTSLENGNKVIVNNATFASGADYMFVGGQTESDSPAPVQYNSVMVNNVTMGTNANLSAYGGYSENGVVDHNYVEIHSGTYGGSDIPGVAGGVSQNSDVTNNKVCIYDGTFNSVSAGFSAEADAEGNILEIYGGTFTTVFGAMVDESYSAVNNEVHIYGGTFNENFMLAGGLYVVPPGTSSGNLLDLQTRIGNKAEAVAFFQKMEFVIPDNTGEAMLKTQLLRVDDAGGTATVNVYAADGVKLNKDDVITLVDSDDTSDTFVGGDILGGAATFYSETDESEDKNGDGDINDLVITLLRDFEQEKSAGSEDQQKAPVEGIAAAVQIVNASADLASGQGMSSLLANTAGGTTDTFGAMSAGSSKYKTGSHVDVDGWGVLVGAGNTKNWKDGSATTYGLFFEYGKGDFDTYNGNVHGDGNSENKGVGIMARHKLANNTYYEGNIRYGKQETEWGESDIGSYDTDSRYYGIMLGVGHIYPAGKNEIDVYGRYSYGHVGACDATVKTSEYHFDSVKSHRVRLGAKYNFVQENNNAKPYVGLAWEHEFKGESKASISGVGEAPAPSMKGNTGIFEVGCDWNVSKKWTLGLGANAYMGKRKGWDGMARVFYNF